MEPEKESEFDALISLLEDGAPNIRRTVVAQLRNYGPSYRERLRRAVESVENPKGRTALRRLVQDFDDEWLATSLQSVLKSPGARSLERATVLLAKSEYPDLQETTITRSLNRLAQELGERMGSRRETTCVVDGFRDFLFGEMGFSSNRLDYFNPENHYLNRVLHRRTGIQISLSILYLLLARRLHLRFEGLAVPGHFLVAYHHEGERVVIDPFNEGQVVPRAVCMNLLSQLDVPFREHYFEQCATTSEIVERMVMNLVGVARRAENWSKQDRLLRLLAQIRRA